MNQEIIAEKLLWPLWRSITDDYKSRYKREIWEHFENAVRASSYTGKLRTYLANFQKRIPCLIQAKYMKDILSVVESGCDEDILDWLRTETTYMIMIVRVRNQERKEAAEAGETDGFSPAGMVLNENFTEFINESKQSE